MVDHSDEIFALDAAKHDFIRVIHFVDFDGIFGLDVGYCDAGIVPGENYVIGENLLIFEIPRCGRGRLLDLVVSAPSEFIEIICNLSARSDFLLRIERIIVAYCLGGIHLHGLCLLESAHYTLDTAIYLLFRHLLIKKIDFNISKN